jgi:hypothetical protein
MILFSEFYERKSHLRVVFNKTSIEVSKPQKTLNIFDICQLLPFNNYLYFGWVHGDVRWRNKIAQKLRSVLVE